jgi:hypothetical protein
MDVGNLLRHTPKKYHEHIQRGLESTGRKLPDDWQQRAEFVDLGSHLEFLTSSRSDDWKAQCVDWIQSFINRQRNSH